METTDKSTAASAQTWRLVFFCVGHVNGAAYPFHPQSAFKCLDSRWKGERASRAGGCEVATTSLLYHLNLSIFSEAEDYVIFLSKTRPSDVILLSGAILLFEVLGGDLLQEMSLVRVGRCSSARKKKELLQSY
ncbi:hypothetical protein C2S51_031445 [Perilla frutescens var. frutescens]|nr:hypothetical protein C2S51_031445 [Perilla frutescens var. frutescens]